MIKLYKINKVIYPIVGVLLVATTSYLFLLYKHNQSSKSDETTQIIASSIIVDDNLSKGLVQGGLSNAAAITSNQSGDIGIAASNEVERSSHQFRVTEILTQIDELLADDNEFKAVDLARSIMGDPDPAIRSEAVVVFAWAGIKGLADLSKMLADPDAGVAREACDAWESALDDITDEGDKAQILTAGIKIMNDEASAESAIMEFDSMDVEMAIPAIVDIIQFGTPVASGVAREHYEFFTSEVYTTPDAATKWVENEMAENADQDLSNKIITKEQQ